MEGYRVTREDIQAAIAVRRGPGRGAARPPGAGSGLMQFKLDENLPRGRRLLRQRGYEVATVYDQGLRGREDHEIAEVCRAEGRVLVSLDLDFSDIRMFPPENYPGLIVLRLRAKGRSAVWNVLQGVLGPSGPGTDRRAIVDRGRTAHPHSSLPGR